MLCRSFFSSFKLFSSRFLSHSLTHSLALQANKTTINKKQRRWWWWKLFEIERRIFLFVISYMNEIWWSRYSTSNYITHYQLFWRILTMFTSFIFDVILVRSFNHTRTLCTYLICDSNMMLRHYLKWSHINHFSFMFDKFPPFSVMKIYVQVNLMKFLLPPLPPCHEIMFQGNVKENVLSN